MKLSKNLRPLSYMELGTSIQSVFVDSEKYTFDKHVPTLEVEGKYVGDLFDITILEPRTGLPPVFYHTFSPFDVISGKTSQYAAVFEAAELLFAAEVTTYVEQRTGVMSPLVMKALGMTDLMGKSVLFIGTGKVARCALAALRSYYPGLNRADFTNAGSDAAAFRALASELGIEARRGDLGGLGGYDVIICHAAAKQPILTKEMLGQIKPGAFISTFASEDHTEVTEDYYDAARARVIVDWAQTADEAVELKAALAKGLTRKENLVLLKDLFSSKVPDTTARYTIYRSHGTPMQNLAFLKLCMTISS